jgi:hypothetical protein
MTTADNIHPETDLPEQRITTPDKPEGPIVAAILAGGVGCFAMGLFTTLGEASTSIKDWLNWNNEVGPLSGKTIMTVIVWLLSWAILYGAYRNRRVETRPALTIALVLIGLGVLGTFPTFFQLFTPE